MNEHLSGIDNFGYKTAWIAVKTGEKSKIADFLGLKNVRLSNWEDGIDSAYYDKVFITPQIGEWTLATGWGLPPGDSVESIEILEKLINKLSNEFGEAQFFGTYRVTGYNNWMKSVNGKIERIYACFDGEILKVFGEQTKAESELNLFDLLSKEAAPDDYLVDDDEELVMEIAEKWSINPQKMSERTDIKNEAGLIGE